MLYSSADEGMILKYKEAFEAKYPNVTMEYYFAGSGQIVTKLSTEMQTGAVGCDVVSELAIPVDWNEMVEGVADMLAKFDELFKS